MAVSRTTAALAIVTALACWAFAVYQLVTDRWAGSTELLLVLACIATVGAVFVVPAVIEGAHWITAGGLVLVAFGASASVYPLSAVVLVLALVQIGIALSRVRRDKGQAQS